LHQRGFTSRLSYERRGGLLPRHFTLTLAGGILSVALSVAFYSARELPGLLSYGVRTFLTPGFHRAARQSGTPPAQNPRERSTVKPTAWQDVRDDRGKFACPQEQTAHVPGVKPAITSLLAQEFQNQPVAAVYVFGSVARGTDRTDSDIDIAVLYLETPSRTLMERPFLLEAALSLKLHRPVQIIVLNDAPADLVHRVLRDGLIILEKDAARRVEFEVRSRNLYWDLLPVLKEYRGHR